MHRGVRKDRKKSDTETWNSTTAALVLLRVLSKAPIHGTYILNPHPTDEARKIVSCLRTLRTQHSGWTRTRHLEFFKSVPLPLSYRLPH